MLSLRLRWIGVVALMVLGMTGGSAYAQSIVIENKTITSFVDWSGKTVHVRGLISIEGQGHLKLDHARVLFEPKLEDTTGIQMSGRALLEARNTVFQSGSGRQWNLEASGSAQIRWKETRATDHSGIRMHDNASFTATGGDVEEVQTHDNARLTLDNASAYIVLYFIQRARANFPTGVLETGDGLTKTFPVPTGSGTALVRLNNASVYGWQIDLTDTASVVIHGGQDILLALHLNNVHRTFTQTLTSANPGNGAVSFGPGGPAFSYTDTTVGSLNVYAGGNSRLDFEGPTDMTEVNAFDSAVITMGSRVRLAANLAQTYDTAKMIIQGVTLYRSGGDGSIPSFTAQGNSRIELNHVLALPVARVYSENTSQVVITKGRGWTKAMCQAINPVGVGGITINGVRVAP